MATPGDDDEKPKRKHNEDGSDFDILNDGDDMRSLDEKDMVEDGDYGYTDEMAEKDKKEMMDFADCLHDWIATVFDKYDTDNDGHIDRHEAA